ncbi:hypothetical protein [Paraburkholderia sp. C35]|uniref:hypothetical protein n=1 Tax=Paraburkholderia sp. C35 TaxID=2126993 RepID=UPI000D69BA98|nr:hypothetical protein [Paraburkholderia sp. C35]
MVSDKSIDLRIKAERIIRADRLANGRDVSHLQFERRYTEALIAYRDAVIRINEVLTKLFP